MKRNGLLIISLFTFFISFSQVKKKGDGLLPEYIKIQFAGGIGAISLGAGYDSRNTKLEGDFIYGYVPKKIGGITIHTISSKITWFPIKKIDLKTVAIKPLSVGLLVNYTFGKQYFLFSPEKYPYNYYDHPTAIHLGSFVGGQVKMNLPNKHLKRLAFYYEIVTYDVELISYISNTKSLRLTDIFNIGLGIKASL